MSLKHTITVLSVVSVCFTVYSFYKMKHLEEMNHIVNERIKYITEYVSSKCGMTSGFVECQDARTWGDKTIKSLNVHNLNMEDNM